MRFQRIIPSLAALLFMSCKTVPSDGEQTKLKSAAEYDVIITQCAAPQGNGSNWGATIGWLSETILKRAEEGVKLESQGFRVGLYMACIAGGSSGSHVANIYMNVLRNPNIVAPKSGIPILSPSEAVTVADALRFIGMTADLNILELSNFALRLVKEIVEGQITGLLANVPLLQGIARDVFRNETPAWWTGQVVSADKVIVDFLVANHLARTMTKDLLYTKSRSDFIQAYNRKELVKNKRYFRYSDIPRQDSTAGVREKENLKKRAVEINKIADQYLAAQHQLLGYKKRYAQGIYQNISPVLKPTAEQALAVGVCTFTVGSVYDDLSDIDLANPPPYYKLAIATFCDKKTLEQIFASPHFKKDYANEPMMKKFIFAAVRNSRASIAVSVREPLLMQETVGKFAGLPLETDLIFDPLTGGDPVLTPPDEKALAIVGGFTDRRISAWPISYYYLEVLEQLKAKTGKIKGYMEIFGKPDNRSEDKFDTKSIRNIFSKDEADGQKNVEDWFAIQDRYCELFEPRFAAFDVIVQTTAFNWDIGRFPAGHSGNSSIVLGKGINATRLQTQPHSESYVFDPTIDQGYIPNTKNIPCKPQ